MNLKKALDDFGQKIQLEENERFEDYMLEKEKRLKVQGEAGEFQFMGHTVRSVLLNGEPYFVGKDIALILGYTNPRKALSDHVFEDDKDGVTIRDSLGRSQIATGLNESGVYSLILSSKLPEAKKFKRWVTKELLPAIHKYGKYDPENNHVNLTGNNAFERLEDGQEQLRSLKLKQAKIKEQMRVLLAQTQENLGL